MVCVYASYKREALDNSEDSFSCFSLQTWIVPAMSGRVYNSENMKVSEVPVTGNPR
jgi:hypothetical protein